VDPVATIIDELINVPFIEDDQEAWVIKSIVLAAFQILENVLVKKTV
jgi:hypothetical protein